MIQGSYAPNTENNPVYEKKCEYGGVRPTGTGDNTPLVTQDEAPTGMMARGHYEAVSKFIDDDDHTHLKFEWSFDIAKDWK